MTYKQLAYWFFALCLSVSISTVSQGQNTKHPASNLPIPKSHLTEHEFVQAVNIAKNQMSLQLCGDESPNKRTVLSGVESVSDNNSNSRLAIVTTYNYDCDTTTRQLVDLAREVVVDKRVTDGGAAPLAEGEKQIARDLVLDDPEIAKFLDFLGEAKSNVKVELLLTRTQNALDQFYRKRVAVALLKTSLGYPQNMPKIVVNLTDLEVVFLR